MISGMHALIYSQHADQVREFLREVFEFPSVDAGGGWPIFAAPPTELAVHETDGEPGVELYFMCGDVRAAVAKLAARGVATTEVTEQRWGSVTTVTLPGGETIGLYEPKHPSPLVKT